MACAQTLPENGTNHHLSVRKNYLITMKLADNPPKKIDEVITGLRSIKRSISDRHGNDIDRLLVSLISQEHASEIG
jgi:hypothetical protein